MPDITIESPDGQFSAYLASPQSGSGAGVLVIQEIFGVNQDMRDHCDALAAEGYFALCPDIFWRQEPGVQITDQSEEEWQQAFSLFQGFDVDKGVEDLIVSLKHLRAIEGCNGKVGTIGFCLGGKLVYLMAARSDADCNVSYYGVGLEELLGEADQIKSPTLLHIAEEDEFCPKEAQAKVKAALADHSQVTIHSYAGANHAFARHNGVHYDAAATSSAEERTRACFSAALG